MWSDAELTHVLGEVIAEPRRQRSVLDDAVIDLVSGSIDKAIAGFELASSKTRDQQEALTDLSAAYLAQFDARHDCIDLLRAVNAADRGLRLSPGNVELRFNRAIALARLGARTLAARDVNAMDAEDSWRREAAANVQALDRPTVDEAWQRELPRLDAPAVTAVEVNDAVARMPMSARVFCESQLLPRWAVAAERGERRQAAHDLRLASLIADALRRARHDELASDAVESIRRIMTSGTAVDRRRLFAGLRAFGDGTALYEEQKLSSAERPLRDAVSDLGAVGNPLAYWARFYLAIYEYYGNAAGGFAKLEMLLHGIPIDRYPALTGRIEWIAGTAEQVQGHVQSSMRRYEHSAACLRRVGGDPAAAFVTVLLAQTYTALGEHRAAWNARLQAFHSVPYSEGLRRNIAMWSEAIQALVRQNALTLARPLVEEEVVAAEKWGRGLGIATAYLDRAAYRLEAGEQEAASADLRRAKDAIATMEAGKLRDQMTYVALLTDGLLARRESPERAATLLRAALGAQASTGTIFDSITYTTELANMQIASGDNAGGAASLTNVISLMERVRATVEDPVTRMQAFRQAQPAFDRLIELRMSAGDVAGAFAFIERARSRVVLDMRSGGNGGRFIALRDAERLVPEGTALVSFVVLEHQVAAWIVGSGNARCVTLDAERHSLEREIDALRLEVARDASADAIRAASAPLYRHLIAPLRLSDRVRSLVIVPDRFLARVPFAILFDDESKQYLIEQREVSLAPSATVLARRASPIHRQLPQTALVIAVSRPGSFRGAEMPGLPGADRDGAEAAAVYSHAIFFRGDEATRGNFLKASLNIDVIHFSGHAVIDAESPRRSVLLFAAKDSPAFEPLSLGEVLDSGLAHVRLVVLAACRTEDSLADDREGQMGLAGAFVAGGADEVFASSFDVADETAAPLMAAFHRAYRESGSASAAFRAAVLSLLRDHSGHSSAPAVWGGFTVIRGTMTDGGVR